MLDSMAHHMSEILSFFGGLVSGSLLTFHFTRQNSSRARGDIVGGDKTTSDRR